MAKSKRGRVKRQSVAGARETKRARDRASVRHETSNARRVPNRELVGDVALLNAIAAAKRARDLAVKTVEDELTRHVRRARRAGVTWTRIAEAVGVTQAAASTRWGPYPVKPGYVRRGRKPGASKVQPTPQTPPDDAPRESNLTQ